MGVRAVGWTKKKAEVPSMKGVEAMEAVSEAMRVIVDFMVGEDTEPMERVAPLAGA